MFSSKVMNMAQERSGIVFIVAAIALSLYWFGGGDIKNDKEYERKNNNALYRDESRIANEGAFASFELGQVEKALKDDSRLGCKEAFWLTPSTRPNCNTYRTARRNVARNMCIDMSRMDMLDFGACVNMFAPSDMPCDCDN
jgi:hypothetical protein